MDTQSSFQSSRLQIQAIHNSVEKLKDIADRMTARALGKSSVKGLVNHEKVDMSLTLNMTTKLESVFTWCQSSHVGLSKQWNGGMLRSQTNLLGVELFTANTFFCTNKFAWHADHISENVVLFLLATKVGQFV